MTINMYISSFAWLCLLVGYTQRKRRKVHVSLVSLGIALDIGMVLYLQITRDAIQTALGPKLDLLQRAHILASSTALVLYFPVIYFGLNLLFTPGTKALRSKHRKFALCALFFRTLGFLLMFSLIKKQT